MWIIIRTRDNGDIDAFGPIDHLAGTTRLEAIADRVQDFATHAISYRDKVEPQTYTLVPITQFK